MFMTVSFRHERTSTEIATTLHSELSHCWRTSQSKWWCKRWLFSVRSQAAAVMDFKTQSSVEAWKIPTIPLTCIHWYICVVLLVWTMAAHHEIDCKVCCYSEQFLIWPPGASERLLFLSFLYADVESKNMQQLHHCSPLSVSSTSTWK